jgi:hypothetical protein
MELDGFIDLFMEFSASPEVVRCKPATDTIIVQIGTEAFCKLLILGGVADKAGVELEWTPNLGISYS